MIPTEDQKLEAKLIISRAFKRVFQAVPVPLRWVYRVVFLETDGVTLRRPSETVLRHLRAFCFADRSIFGGRSGTSDSAFLLGVREGRRQVWLEMMKYLNLNENEVDKILENDDGR